MDFWSIFSLFITNCSMAILIIYTIYDCCTDKECRTAKKWLTTIMGIISLIALMICSSFAINASFKKCIKSAYYNGVSVKAVPKLKSDYTIEKVDSIFYINKMRE